MKIDFLEEKNEKKPNENRNFQPLSLHKKFIEEMVIFSKNSDRNFDRKTTFSESQVLKMISCIYLDKIKNFSNKELSLMEISYCFFLNKYGNMKNIADQKYYQVNFF